MRCTCLFIFVWKFLSCNNMTQSSITMLTTGMRHIMPNKTSIFNDIDHQYFKQSAGAKPSAKRVRNLRNRYYCSLRQSDLTQTQPVIYKWLNTTRWSTAMHWWNWNGLTWNQQKASSIHVTIASERTMRRLLWWMNHVVICFLRRIWHKRQHNEVKTKWTPFPDDILNGFPLN